MAADFAKMRSLFFKNWAVKYLLCLKDIFTKYTLAKTVLHGFIKIVNNSKRKPNELWVDQRREFYNILMQKWLDNRYI